MQEKNIPVVLVSNTSWYLYNFRRGTIAALREAGYRVVALAPQDDYSARLVEELGIEHMPLPMEGKSTRLLGEGKSLLALAATLRRLKPGFVFNFTVKANIYSGLACRVLSIPYANNVSGLGTAFLHDSWLFRRVRGLYGLANRGAQRVFFQNQEDHDLFQHHGLLRDTPTTVLPGSGMNTERFTYSTLPPPAPFTFVMIARLLGDKGVREYVAAAAKLREHYPEVVCRLVGDTDENPDSISQQELDEWVASDTLEVLGKLADVRPAIADASVYVLPSYREGTPRTVLEAMAMGRPIITTDAPGCRETVVEGDNGYLVPVKNVDALCQAMRRFIEEPKLAATMGARSRAIAEEKYDVHRVNAVMLEAMNIYRVETAAE